MKNIFSLVIAGFLIALSPSMPAATVAYWKFDEIESDSSPAALGESDMNLVRRGSGEVTASGEVAADPVPAPDKTSGFKGSPQKNSGSALIAPASDSSNSYMETASSEPLKLNGTQWTFEGWLRPAGNTMPVDFGQIIFSTRDHPQLGGVTLKLDPPAKPGAALSLGFLVTMNRDATDNLAIYAKSKPLIRMGEWNHFAVTWDDKRGKGNPPKARIYIDGTEAGEAEAAPEFSTTAADDSSNRNIRIGGRRVGSDNTFDGNLDEFRISDQILPPEKLLPGAKEKP